MDLDAYRAAADGFLAELTREYYLHFAGHKGEFEIEPIYERHAGLFSRSAVDELRAAGNRELLDFAVQGFLGQATKAEEAELARREAELEIEVDGDRMPYRQAPVTQANETDPDRREAIEAARNDALERHLTPLQLAVHERAAELTRELGWESMLVMCEELGGLDLRALERQTAEFLRRTEPDYEARVGPQLERTLGYGFDRLRRADLPAFFRAPADDVAFPAERLLPALRETLAGLGFDLDGQPNVHVDAEPRPTKSPRAFCAPVRVPEEIYLVIAPVGGRDDFEALFHEAGHTQHFAHVNAGLDLERRHLGDNSFTEAFAFLFHRLCQNPVWMADVLGVGDPEPIAAHAEAAELVYLRRYAAKIGYEIVLHSGGDGDLPGEYARRLSEAVHVDWPRATWLADVDPFFYVARYLRAWALERRMAAALAERFGERWWRSPDAGGLLRAIWRQGQRPLGEELLAELGEEPRIDFAALP